tara:strand:+ start:48 stop:956 length:909 start_codon:yes stop_codon:yes gene_type:complete
MESTNNNLSSTPGEQPTLMKKISNTISSLMPGSKSATKSESVSTKPTSTKDNTIFEEIITESRTKTQSPTKLMSDLDKASTADSNSPSSDSGFLSSMGELFKNVYFKIIMLILILAFLGFNLFKYLADATDSTTDLLGDPIKQIAAIFGYTVGETTKNIVDTSAEGTKLGIDVAAGATEDAIDLGQRALGASSTSTQKSSSENKSTSNSSSTKSSNTKSEKDDLDKAINDGSSNKNNNKQSIPEPDDATSKTQSSKASKSGYCYIGEDRGFRSCIKVNDPNRCMSGEIFPTRDICINPTLRE